MEGEILTDDFFKKWEEEGRGIRGSLRPVEPLKFQVNKAIKYIEAQLNRVNEYIEHYTSREKDLSEKIIQAYEKYDDARAKLFANELAEIRKHKDLLINSKLSLDKAIVRLRTLYELGNFTSVMHVAKRIVGEIRTNIADLIPGMNTELMQAEKMFDEIMLEVSQGAIENLNFNAEGLEAEKILEEAAIVAESKMKIKFPDLPKNKGNENAK
ncbi:MAG: hypothetical protein QXI48_02935 [Candidatus Bathyarchaeia archaeon]